MSSSDYELQLSAGIDSHLSTTEEVKFVPSENPVEIAEQATQAVESNQGASKVPSGIDNTGPSILYCCPGSILDITSGAALSLRTILAALVKKGFRAVALQATIFDSPQGGEHVYKAGESQKSKPIWRSSIDGVEHLIVKTALWQRKGMTCQEEETYINLFRRELRVRRPDMIFLWGGLVLERTLMREAQDAGIPVIFYLVNPGYKDKTAFRDVSVIITDTQSTADLYKQRHDFDLKVVGKFIDKLAVVPKVPRSPDFITFINPSFEKGVSVFMPLAKLAAKECPEIKFLVVQSRGRWISALHVLKYKAEDFSNVKVIGHQTNMRPIYASTRALLLPSLWHESGARVIAEAQLNGIPIIASNTGGSAELVGLGGRIFELPAVVKEKKTEVHVTEDDLRPWLEEIKRLWHDQVYYAEMCRKVEQEAVQHDSERNADRFIKAVGPAVLASKGLGPDGKPHKSAKKDSDKPTMLQHALAKKQALTAAKITAKDKFKLKKK